MRDETASIEWAEDQAIGAVVEEKWRKEREYTPKIISCPKCNGSGILGQVKCNLCTGTGELIVIPHIR
jgi:hypothetical protein